MYYGVTSQHAETIEDVLQLGAAQELVTRGVLAADLLEGPRQDRLFDLSRHHDDPVGIAEDEVAGFHANAGADDRHVDVGDLAATLRVERRDAAMEDRETGVADGAHGAREAGHHKLVIEGSHARCHRLVAKARLVEHIGQHRRVELLAELLEKTAIASLQTG